MKTDRKITHILILISILFLSLVVYLTYFELYSRDKVVANSYNQRQWEAEDKTLRGSFTDRNGVVLAKSSMVDGKQQREYPFGSIYSHIIGYNSRVYGKTQLEAQLNSYLLGLSEFSPVFGLKDKLQGNQKEGNNVCLTIDNNLQILAGQLLGERKGSVVALNPKTGEILAMVSKPDFDPNDRKLSENWVKLTESEDSPFLPRATQGLYAPGSTYKVVISTKAVENGMLDRVYEDTGKVNIDGREFTNFGGEANGSINLKSALAVSSNVVFSQVGVELGADNLLNIAERMGFGKDIPFDLPVNKSVFPYRNMSKTDMAAVGIGQGKLQVTPLHMGLIAAAIANNGNMMKPLLVSKILTPDGSVIKAQKPGSLSQVMSQETSSVLRDMMKGVVENGTGANAAISGIKVAGKTGTAENELTVKGKGKEHAWFIGFAPADNPQIAVTVILEYSGTTGGEAAAPIARDLMAAWLARQPGL